MRKQSGLILSVIVLLIIFCYVYCENSIKDIHDHINVMKNESNELVEQARRRKNRHHHAYYHHWGWHALAIAYFIKVKLVIIAFFVGSAVMWGLRYFWPHKCAAEVVREGPVVYNHPPSYSHYDHIPYSFDHVTPYRDHSFEPSVSFDSIPGNEPYSAYGDSYPDPEPSILSKRHRRRRHIAFQQHEPRYLSTEEQIAEFIFQFLGLNSLACRRRFICEMEFRSKSNPLTSMAFRIVGRGFFEKYTNARNENGKAASFGQCANVNDQCKVIEEHLKKEDKKGEHQEGNVVDEMSTNTLGFKDNHKTIENLEAKNIEQLMVSEILLKNINKSNNPGPLFIEEDHKKPKLKRRHRRPRSDATNNTIKK